VGSQGKGCSSSCCRDSARKCTPRFAFDDSNWSRGLPRWKEKFRETFYCGGSPEEQAAATLFDWISHLVGLIWKIIFLLIPPPVMYGGWPAFFAALCLIGFCTSLISDMANLLGCVMDIPNDITAITLVALGTSLPDTLASRAAALGADTADDAIGNITGSNSVNVFLGLGLTWTFGSIYWNLHGRTREWQLREHKGQTYQELWGSQYSGGGFIIPSDTLGFSVGVYSVMAVACVLLLAWRRQRYGGELGGPKHSQRRDFSILVSFWLIYLAASISRSLSDAKSNA
jgi:solute carrier family 8 (sodium/calcium exchanger)